MTFDRLFVIFTDPFFWHLDDPQLPDLLARFFATLLDGDRPGRAWLGIPDPRDEDETIWVDGDEALAAIGTARQAWLAARERSLGAGDAYSLFVAHPLTAFVDRQRLRALVAELTEGEPPDALDHEQVVGISLFNDWATVEDHLVWTPQLRVLGYWPENPRLAPPAPVDAPARVAHTPQQTAVLLENVLWMGVGNAFARLRLALGFGRAILLGGDFYPPVFYVAVPTTDSVPSHPDAFLQEPDIGALAALTGHIMVTDDPISHDVSGGLLEGSLLTLRREYSRRGVAIDYLLIGWWRRDTEQFGAREEWESIFVADQLAYPDFNVIAPLERLRRAQERSNMRLSLWNGTLDQAAELAGDLQASLVNARRSDAVYSEAFRAVVAHLRLSLARLTPRVLRLADDVRSRQREWQRVQAAASRLARARLSYRTLAGLRPLAELVQSHRDRSIFQEFSFELDHEVERATRVVDYGASVQQHLHDIHDFQQRDEATRQAGRSRRMAAVFGSLAVLTAFPLLVGELDWSGWMAEIRSGSQPGWISDLYLALDAIHGELVFVTTLASMVLVAVVLLSALGLRWFEEGDDRVLGRVRRVRQRLQRAWTNNHVAATQTTSLDAGAIEALDEEACAALAEVFAWLDEAPPPLRRSWLRRDEPIRRQLTELEDRTAHFVVALDLFDDRPDTLALPRLACLMHLKSTDILQSSPISRSELDTVLRVYGFGEDEVEPILGWGSEHRHLPAAQLAAELRQLGVTAAR